MAHGVCGGLLVEYEVTREYGQWHVQEKGQASRGTTVTDAWLDQMGFGMLTRSNIDEVIRTTMAAAGGEVLDRPASRRIPKDVAFTPGSRSYRPRPTHPVNR